ncbi:MULTISPECIES: DUF6812 domain-containing protein [Giesbergeria]|uniref:Uncharacterized protein n=1 Tax=Giesbergeria sinuosa TaxID=80883 RepID=A0ABV9QDT4_9BURK
MTAPSPRIPAQKKTTHKIHAEVALHDHTRCRGFIHLQANQRLQDLLNDRRGFIPLEMSADGGELILISKRFIVYIHETNVDFSDFKISD